jgi:hypothetical protein
VRIKFKRDGKMWVPVDDRGQEIDGLVEFHLDQNRNIERTLDYTGRTIYIVPGPISSLLEMKIQLLEIDEWIDAQPSRPLPPEALSLMRLPRMIGLKERKE